MTVKLASCKQAAKANGIDYYYYYRCVEHRQAPILTSHIIIQPTFRYPDVWCDCCSYPHPSRSEYWRI